MQKQTFYRLDTKQKIREWSIEVEDNGATCDIVIFAGLKDGKKIETRTTVYNGLNIGKANETTVYEQAKFDAQSLINKQEKGGYGPDINNLKGKGDTATIKAPMKAETLKLVPANDKEAKSSYTVKKTGYEGKQVRYDAKLDGWRFRVRVNKNECVFYTSSGDVTLSFPQIEAVVRKVFDKNIGYWESKYGVTEHILDGEIYTHGLQVIRDDKDKITGTFFKPNSSGFAAAASAGGAGSNKTSQSELSPMQKALRDQMQFYIFDIAIDDETVLDSTRLKIVDYYIDDKVIIGVPHFYDTFTDANVKKYMEKMLALGYEGLLIKVPGHPYVFKRSKMLFKYKPLLDDEFKVTGFLKSITGDTLGSFECITEAGVVFSANPKDDFGTDAKKKQIWDNQKDYLGKFITVEFLEYTADGKPRHPRAKGFRKGKSQD